METPKSYALRLLKTKNYYIKEMYDKLNNKYDKNTTNKVIKNLIKNDYLNDKKLVYLKMNYLINEKKYGKNYIIDYFTNKNISYNLITYILDYFNNTIFLNNKSEIIDLLLKKGKDKKYISSYLIRKGYDIE